MFGQQTVTNVGKAVAEKGPTPDFTDYQPIPLKLEGAGEITLPN